MDPLGLNQGMSELGDIMGPELHQNIIFGYSGRVKLQMKRKDTSYDQKIAALKYTIDFVYTTSDQGKILKEVDILEIIVINMGNLNETQVSPFSPFLYALELPFYYNDRYTKNKRHKMLMIWNRIALNPFYRDFAPTKPIVENAIELGDRMILRNCVEYWGSECIPETALFHSTLYYYHRTKLRLLDYLLKVTTLNGKKLVFQMPASEATEHILQYICKTLSKKEQYVYDFMGENIESLKRHLKVILDKLLEYKPDMITDSLRNRIENSCLEMATSENSLYDSEDRTCLRIYWFMSKWLHDHQQVIKLSQGKQMIKSMNKPWGMLNDDLKKQCIIATMPKGIPHELSEAVAKMKIDRGLAYFSDS
jgi:hypothetical protein